MHKDTLEGQVVSVGISVPASMANVPAGVWLYAHRAGGANNTSGRSAAEQAPGVLLDASLGRTCVVDAAVTHRTR